MNQKRKITTGLIPFAIFFIAAWLLCFVQACISMRECSDRPSADCMTCSLAGEIFRYSLFVPFVLALVYLALWKVKNSYRAVILTFIYALACMYVNNEICIVRVSAWSTYTTSEEISATWHLSCLAILVSSVILFPVIIRSRFIERK